MPDAWHTSFSLEPYRRRLRLASSAHAVLLGASAAGATLIMTWMSGVESARSATAAAIAFAVTALPAGIAWWSRWTPARTAAAVQAQLPADDNIIVTAEEIGSGRGRRPHPAVEEPLFDAARARLAELSPNAVKPLTAPALLAAAACVAVVAIAVTLPESARLVAGGHAPSPAASAPLRAGDLRLVITPPAYTQRAAEQLLNPSSVVVLEGSRVRLEVARVDQRVTLVDGDESRVPFTDAGGVLATELVATTTRSLIVRAEEASRAVDRFVHMRVRPDARPVVRISRPAQDLMLPEPIGQVSIEIDAEDDLGLEALALKYTKVSGSGESFTFVEGEWPLQMTRSSRGQWSGRAAIGLDTLKLQDGDTIVYRAVARDAKPGADPASSATFLIEVGRLAGLASTGFALPDDRDRQGLSQQMLIIKTERLLAGAAALARDALLEQSRLLGVEQRMVKSEFVFMTGGEVADEVEEATHAHDLAEGRLENSAQVELLTAIREMSRAEARLNDGAVAEALTFERAALAALQRAFDRRRYLLRTLPERTRIDQSRRLTGDISAARAPGSTTEPVPADPVVSSGRELLRELAAANGGSVSLLASRVAALDTSSDELQKAAVRLATADEASRAQAAREAARVVLDHVQRRLARGGTIGVSHDPLDGRLAEELGGAGRGRK